MVWRTNTFWSFREFHHPNKGTIFESGLDFHLSFYIRRFLLSMSWGRMTSIDSTQLMFFLGKKLNLPKAQRLGFQSFQWWHSKLLKLKTCSIFQVFWHQVSCLFLIPSHGKHIQQIVHESSAKLQLQNFIHGSMFFGVPWIVFQEFFNFPFYLLALQWVLPRAWGGWIQSSLGHHASEKPALEGDV